MIILPDLWSEGISGRLGNQMFEVAAAYALAMRTGHELVIPECHIGRHMSHDLRARVISKDELPRPTKIYREPRFPYSPVQGELGANDTLAMHGYFQSYRYFQDQEHHIRALFYPGTEISRRAGYLANYFYGGNPLVALCVRRGDYVQKSDYHPVQSLDYYRRATDMFMGDTDFVVISDDIPWCRENLPTIDHRLQFCEEKDPWLKLCMMARFDGYIIANSSFHWWGAWLNGSAQKKVVAPKNWFGPASGLQNLTYDICPPEWIQI